VYGVDKEGASLLLGNPFLQQQYINIDCGTQTWRWGYTLANIYLVTAEELDGDL